jgi:hypothetical protein
MIFNSDLNEYSFPTLIRDYSGYPSWLPLPCYYDHGVCFAFDICQNSICPISRKLMLQFNSFSENIWNNDDSVKQSGIKVVNIGNPFIHYRRKHKIHSLPDAKGTIAFPGHSTDLIKASFDIQRYCDLLMALPIDFHPITICIHCDDIKNDCYSYYKKNGFSVVTAGSRYDVNFCKNFYQQLSQHKYSTSNVVGSYTFYAIEMGIPFFILGGEPTLFNIANKDPLLPEVSKISDFKGGRFAMSLFSTGATKLISKEQMDYVLNHLGVNDCISGKKLNKLLWKFFLKDKKLIKYTLDYYKDLFKIKFPKLAIILKKIKKW